MIKSVLLICAIVALVNAQGQGYGVVTSYPKGANCAGTIVDIKYYAVNMCSFYYNIGYTSGESKLTINQYGTPGCTDGATTYPKNFGECTTGDTTDYSWNYTAALDRATLANNFATYTVYGSSTTAKCSTTPTYIAQSAPNCVLNNQNYTKITCNAAGNSATTLKCSTTDNTCGSCFQTITDSRQNNCQLDSTGLYYATSCGPSYNTATTTTTTTTTLAPGTRTTSPPVTDASGNTVSPPTSGDGSNGSNGGNGGSGDATTDSASIASASMFLLAASLAAYLL